MISKDRNLPPVKSEEIADSCKGNIQGSASLPILTADKNSEGLVLRETSSWNEPSINSELDWKSSVAAESLIDAVRGIGDQPSPLERESGS